MSNKISKIGALLAVLALFASLLISIPVGAVNPPVKDVYIKSIGIQTPSPVYGDNVTLTATIKCVAKLPCTKVNVTFSENDAGTLTFLSKVYVPGPVSNTTDTVVNGWWNSSVVSDLVYDMDYNINVTLEMTGDTNLTNNTMESTATIAWRHYDLIVTKVAGAANALIGDAYTATVTVKNDGTADFKDVQTIDIKKGDTGSALASADLNCTVTALVPGATKDVVIVIPDTVTATFTAGEVNLTSYIMGVGNYTHVTFAAKVTAVYVSGIALTPTGVKGTQKVTINATLLNMGTMNAVNMTVTFWYNTSAAHTLVPITSAHDVLVNVSMNNSTKTYALMDWVTPTSTTTVVYTITVKVDQGFKNTTLSVLPTPHTVLGISTIAFNPTTLVAKATTGDKQNMTITVTVANTGDKAAVNAVVVIKDGTTIIFTNNSVNVSIAGTTDVVYTYAVLTPKDDAIMNITASVTLGTDTASAWKNITVPGHIYKSVIVISDLTASVASVEAKLPVTFTATVKNTGDLLAPSVVLTFMAGTTTIGTKTVYNLTVGGTGNMTTMVWTPTTAGKYNINVTISATNYKNMSYTVAATKVPTLVVDFAKDTKGKIKSYSSSGASGSSKTLKIEITLQNTGTADAKNVKVVITDAKGVALGNVTVATIAAGASSPQTIEVKLKAGTSTTLTATATYDGIHGIQGTDKGLTATSPTADSPSAKVVKTPGFEGVILVAAVAVALVVLSRRKKN